MRSPLESANQVHSRSDIEIAMVGINERNPKPGADIGPPTPSANHVEGIQVNVSHDAIISESDLEGRLKSNPTREFSRVDVEAQVELIGVNRHPGSERPAAKAELRLSFGDRRAAEGKR